MLNTISHYETIQTGTPRVFNRVERQPRTTDAQRLEALVIQSRRGSLEAFNEVVLACQDQVFRQAFWILGDEAAAEDATQEAFILAFNKLDSYLGGSFRAWLIRVASNHCLDLLRYNKRRPAIPLDVYNSDDEEIETPSWLVDRTGSPEEMIERADSQAAVMACIQSLAPDYRMALILVDLQEMDYVQAAEILKVPLGTLKSRLARARIQVRARLQETHLQ
jgi:RNA polymerase sigma-70 factor, ECF subfamily